MNSLEIEKRFTALKLPKISLIYLENNLFAVAFNFSQSDLFWESGHSNEQSHTINTKKKKCT